MDISTLPPRKSAALAWVFIVEGKDIAHIHILIVPVRGLHGKDSVSMESFE